MDISWVVANDPITGKVEKTNTAGDGRKQGSPFTYPEQTSRYIVEWVRGAKEARGLQIDYVGIWNERTAPAKYVTTPPQRKLWMRRASAPLSSWPKITT